MDELKKLLDERLKKIVELQNKVIDKDIENLKLKKEINTLLYEATPKFNIEEMEEETIEKVKIDSTGMLNSNNKKECCDCRREDRTSFPNPSYRCITKDCLYYSGILFK